MFYACALKHKVKYYPMARTVRAHEIVAAEAAAGKLS